MWDLKINVTFRFPGTSQKLPTKTPALTLSKLRNLEVKFDESQIFSQQKIRQVMFRNEKVLQF